MHRFLETASLYLRRLIPEDAPLLAALDSDPAVMQFISKGEATPLENIEAVILPRLLSYYTVSETVGFWAAHTRAPDTFVGWFHLRPDRFSPDEMELGYRLKRAVWGRGYATEMSRALIDRGFTAWEYDRIIARARVGNAASRRVMEKCGLRQEGFFTYPADLLPGWTEAERSAVKYGLDRAQYLTSMVLPTQE